MTLRILHVFDHSLPLHSGYSFRSLAILREQRALGWQTVHLTTPKQGAGVALQEEVDGWTFHRTPSAAGTGLLAQMRLTAARLDQLVGETRPHLVHAHSPVLNALPSLWVGRRRRLPVVYEMRASWEDAAVDHGTTVEGSLRYRASRAVESLALRRADQVTTICEGLRRDIAGRGIAAERITVIPNAVDVSLFQCGVEADFALRRSLRLEGATWTAYIDSTGIIVITPVPSSVVSWSSTTVAAGERMRDLRRVPVHAARRSRRPSARNQASNSANIASLRRGAKATSKRIVSRWVSTDPSHQ